MAEDPPRPSSADAPATAETRARSTQRRGPRAAPQRDVVREQTKRLAAAQADCPADTAEAELRNYHRRFGDDPDDDVHFRMTRAMIVAARRWRKVANDRIKPLGQTMARWETLYLVAMSGNQLTQGELARLIGVEGPTMVHMLNALAQDGLIERQQSAVDRRVTVNSITPGGMQVIRDIMAITNELRSELLKRIELDKLTITLETLSSILRHLEDM
jgi:MarR family transcriptional regulator for hemolysin